MTRQLILIRHGESGWDDPFANDHARVLTLQGRNEATAIGRWLSQAGCVPQVILCSDAARTIETSELLTAAMGPVPPMQLDPMLYHASPDTILEQVARANAQSTAVVAHNPGIGMLADAILRQRPAHHRFLDYPPCATTVIDFDGPMVLGQGDLAGFVVPSDLPILPDANT